MKTIWFPETLVARLALREEGRSVTTGVVGFEGLIGGGALLGDDHDLFDVIAILRGGTALGVPIATLRQWRAERPALYDAVIRASRAVALQTARLLVSALQETSVQRLSRWLLLLDERANGAALAATHQELGEWAGLRRASVTESLHLLEGDHLVRCERGRVVVRDRAGLERRLQRD